MNINWEKYIEKTKEYPPRELLKDALAHVAHKGTALDLGAGALMDSKYLLEQGYDHVVALDADPVSARYAEEVHSEHFSFVQSTFQDFEFLPDTFDLINAQRSLPYVGREEFDSIFSSVKSALKSEGILCAVIFGDRNSHSLPAMTPVKLSRPQVEELLSDLEVIMLDENEEDKLTTMGSPLHSHEFFIIARKK